MKCQTIHKGGAECQLPVVGKHFGKHLCAWCLYVAVTAEVRPNALHFTEWYNARRDRTKQSTTRGDYPLYFVGSGLVWRMICGEIPHDTVVGMLKEKATELREEVAKQSMSEFRKFFKANRWDRDSLTAQKLAEAKKEA